MAQTSLLDVCEGSHAVTLSPFCGRRVSAVPSHNAGILRPSADGFGPFRAGYPFGTRTRSVGFTHGYWHCSPSGNAGGADPSADGLLDVCEGCHAVRPGGPRECGPGRDLSRCFLSGALGKKALTRPLATLSPMGERDGVRGGRGRKPTANARARRAERSRGPFSPAPGGAFPSK